MTEPVQRRRLDDEFLTRRESETLTEASRERDDADKAAHLAVHDSQFVALRTAMDVAERERIAHNLAHQKEHELHVEKHQGERDAVKVAMAAVDRERVIHAEAHDREHGSHKNEHALNDTALEKAERAADQRFASVNEFREQLREQARDFASGQRVETLSNDMDRRFSEMLALLNDRFHAAEKLTQERYDANRASIVAIEKLDVRGEGRSLGQGSTIAAIVGAVGFAALAIGLIVTVANLLAQ